MMPSRQRLIEPERLSSVLLQPYSLTQVRTRDAGVDQLVESFRLIGDEVERGGGTGGSSAVAPSQSRQVDLPFHPAPMTIHGRRGSAPVFTSRAITSAPPPNKRIHHRADQNENRNTASFGCR
jgi:hypothetical protein